MIACSYGDGILWRFIMEMGCCGYSPWRWDAVEIHHGDGMLWRFTMEMRCCGDVPLVIGLGCIGDTPVLMEMGYCRYAIAVMMGMTLVGLRGSRGPQGMELTE